jgi:hypothetical protein
MTRLAPLLLLLSACGTAAVAAEPTQHIYHPWLMTNGELSGGYYADQHGRWLCTANRNGEPLDCRPALFDDLPPHCAVTTLYFCNGSNSHDHTLAPHGFADGSLVGGGIDPGDPVR